MNTATILNSAVMDGIKLSLSSTGTIKASGRHDAVYRWLPKLRDHRAEIIATLNLNSSQSAVSFDQEWFEERAAIYQFYAGFTRKEAERLALKEVMNHG